MANELVRIIRGEDEGGDRDAPWHLVSPVVAESATLCGSEYFGCGQSDLECELKTTAKGGVTCQECLRIIKAIKAVKL